MKLQRKRNHLAEQLRRIEENLHSDVATDLVRDAAIQTSGHRGEGMDRG